MKKVFFVLSFFLFTTVYSQLKFGQTPPDFKLWLINGEKITNTTTHNKVVVFKFWFTSCVPCISGIPKLNALAEKYIGNNQVLFIAPALDNKDVIKRFLKHYPFHFNIAYNAIDVANVFNPNGVYPTYVIIDKNGKIAYFDSQYKKSNASDLEQVIERLLE